jgi:hypothetical protein
MAFRDKPRYALPASCAWEVPVITGPEEGTAAGRGHLRAAHADREHVIDLLKGAFVQDRLTKDELDARTGHALTAGTYAELAALTADIPAGPPATRPPRQPARPQNRPAHPHPVRNAAIGSASCLTVAAAAFLYGVYLDDHTAQWFFLLTVFALMAVLCIIAQTAATWVEQRRPAGSYRRDRARAANPPKDSGTALPGMIRLPPVAAPTRPAPTCGPAGPGRTGRARPGRARAGGVSRYRAAAGQRRARPEPLLHECPADAVFRRGAREAACRRSGRGATVSAATGCSPMARVRSPHRVLNRPSELAGRRFATGNEWEPDPGLRGGRTSGGVQSKPWPGNPAMPDGALRV